MAAGAVSGDAIADEGAQAGEVGHQSPSTSQVPPTLICDLRGASIPVTRWRGIRETWYQRDTASSCIVCLMAAALGRAGCGCGVGTPMQ